MNTHNPILKTLSAFLALTSFVTWAVPVYADNLPAGYEAVAGGSFYTASPDGTTGNLTATDEATIGQWNGGFNIGAGNTFNAYLPSGDSVHLSRDITANPSEIFGALNVPQGKFFLVNSSGIFFAPGSQVNAAGLVASTLDINNQDFLSGRYHFAQSANANPASVVSAGTMNIGTNGAALIGGAVANRGVILAQGSSLVLAAGSEATVSFDNSGQLSVLVDKGTIETVKDNDGAAIKDAVLNKGIVKTEGGIVVMTAEAANSIFDNLVNNTGIIEAQSLGTKEGKIVLSSKQSEGIVMNSGTLDASGKDAGEKGGKVVVEGQIAVNQGTIDVSGDANGGIVLLGGDYQGLNPGIRNADYTYVGDNSVIKADSLFQGDGGKIVLWSDKVTQSRGWIFARGGVAGGDGGFVETSSRGYLDVVNPVDASAANGNAGLWLLDPTDIVITSATDNQLNTSGTNPIVYSPTGSASRVTNTTIQTALNAGTSVTVSTVGSPGSPGHSGDITVNASITKTGGSDATFTLLAADDITVNNAISSNTNLLNVTFTAGGQITLNDGGSVTSNGGDVTFTAGDNVSIEDTINAGTGDILITTTGDVIGLGISGDGKKLLWARRSQNMKYILMTVYAYDLKSRSAVRLPFPDRISVLNPNPSTAPEKIEMVSFSPDGTKVAIIADNVQSAAGSKTPPRKYQGCYVVRLEGGEGWMLYRSPGAAKNNGIVFPAWTRDGQRIGLLELEDKALKLAIFNSDGTGGRRLFQEVEP